MIVFQLFWLLTSHIVHCTCYTNNAIYNAGKSLMAKWLEQASLWHEMYCHDLEVMSLKPGRVELGVRSTSVLTKSYLFQK